MKHNRLFTFLITVTFSCILCTFVHQARADSTVFSSGDVNGDGFVDAVDASAVLAEYAQISAELPESFSPAQKSAADVNNDGFNDAVDASQILSYYAYLSTGGTLKIDEYNVVPVSTTVISDTTARTTTTTAVVTIPPGVKTGVGTVSWSSRKEFTKYDIMDEDAVEAKSALAYLSDKLGPELFGNPFYSNQYGEFLATDLAYAIIVNLNYNQGINIRALGDNYQDATEEEFLQLSDNMDLTTYQFRGCSKIDWTEYTLDEELGRYINEVSAADQERTNGNVANFSRLKNEFRNSDMYDNYAKYYFMINTINSPEYDCEEMNEARELFFNEVSRPLFDAISQNKGIVRKTIYYYMLDGEMIIYKTINH